ncbi:MAG: hypothetical protein RL689_655 [Planctomycetota bacterium]
MTNGPTTTPRSHPSARPPLRDPRWWQVAALVGVFGVAAFFVLQALRPAPAPVDAGEVRGSSASLDEILNAAATLKRDGTFNKAETLLREAITRHVAEQRLYVEYAEVLVATRREKEAYEQYEKALAAADGTHAIHLAAGTVASMIGRLDRAVEHFAAAQQADKTDWRAPLFLAQVQIKLSQNAEATKNLMLAVNLKPDAAIAWGSLAELELRDNKLSLAAQHVAKAREFEPGSTVWRVLEARILKRENKPDEALALLAGLDAAQRLEPGVLNTMAECLGMLSRPGDAAKLYGEASQAQPLRGDLAMQAAVWHDRAGERAAALVYARRAAEAGEEHAAELVTKLEKAGGGSKKKR